MDPRQHTFQLLNHGQYLSHRDGASGQPTLVREFSQCRSPLLHDIRLPTPYGWIEDVDRALDPPFIEKLDDRLGWRGRNTGVLQSKTALWKNMHRNFLMREANEVEGTIQVLWPNVSSSEPVGHPLTLRKSRVNQAMMMLRTLWARILPSRG